MSRKSLALEVLRGNSKGNLKETKSFLTENKGKLLELPRKPEGNQKEKAGYLRIPPAELIRATLAELNNAGCWTDCPELLADDKDTAGELEASVDGAALAGDMRRLKAALDGYRDFWLARRTRRQVTCGSCTHFQPAPVGAWGMGSCAAGLEGILWPNRRRYCDQWQEAAPL